MSSTLAVLQGDHVVIDGELALSAEMDRLRWESCLVVEAAEMPELHTHRLFHVSISRSHKELDVEADVEPGEGGLVRLVLSAEDARRAFGALRDSAREATRAPSSIAASEANLPAGRAHSDRAPPIPRTASAAGAAPVPRAGSVAPVPRAGSGVGMPSPAEPKGARALSSVGSSPPAAAQRAQPVAPESAPPVGRSIPDAQTTGWSLGVPRAARVQLDATRPQEPHVPSPPQRSVSEARPQSRVAVSPPPPVAQAAPTRSPIEAPVGAGPPKPPEPPKRSAVEPPPEPPTRNAAQSPVALEEPGRATIPSPAPESSEVARATMPSPPPSMETPGAPPLEATRPATRAGLHFSGPIAPIEDVASLLGAREGPWQSGAKLTVPEIFLRAGRCDEDVLLQLGNYLFYFSGHHLVRLKTPDGDGVLRQLVRSMALRQQAADKLLAETNGDHPAAEQLAVDRGLVPAGKLVGAMRDFFSHHAPEIVRVSGYYTVRSAVDPNASLALSLDRCGREILVQALRSLPTETVRDFVEGENFELAPAIVAGMAKRIEKLKLSSRDERFVERLDGTRTFSDCSQQSPMSKEALHHLILSLVGLGILELRACSGKAITTEAKLRARLQKAKGANAYRVLDLHWTAHPEEVEERIARYRKELRTDLTRESEEAKELGLELLRLCEAAAFRLSNFSTRKQAREEIVGQDEMHSAFLLFEKQLAVEEMRTDDAKVRRMRDIMREIRDSGR
ncbi:MAG: hypothetical protein HYV07_03160 [Deltaproteobacteria bacterium]|nr:hypothetical protein [Deltaproteobacteria bacterium]